MRADGGAGGGGGGGGGVLRVGRGGVAQVDVDDGRGCMRGYRGAVDALEDGADGPDVLLWRVAQDVDTLLRQKRRGAPEPRRRRRRRH